MTVLRRIVLVALVLVAAGAFAAENQVTETVLPNGLKVLIKEVHSAPVFTHQIWYKVGSRNEHTGITGVSHIVEHMLFKGTKEYGKGQFSSIIQSKGGQDNGGTSSDYTLYYQLMSKDHLELVIKLEADRMKNALFDPKEFEAERIVVRSELEGNENDIDTVFYQTLQAVAYQVHPYRWPTIGYVQDVENVTRDQAYNYYQTYYQPNNATVVIVGDVDTQATLELVRKYYGSIPKGPEPPKVHLVEPKQNGERRFVLERPGTAARTMIAYHIPDISHPDVFPLMMLDQVLSGGRSARLYQALVEGQLATSAWSSSYPRKDPGLFTLGATGSEGVTAAQLEQALLDEVEKIKAAPPSEEELTRARNQLEAYLVFQNDSVTQQGELLGFYESVISWKYLETILPNVKEVTPADVQRVANQYLTKENRTVGWFDPVNSPTAGTGSGVGAPSEYNFKNPMEMEIAYYKSPGSIATPRPIETVVNAKTPTRLPESGAKAVEPKRTVLKNGMVVIVHENHSNPTIAIRGTLKAGGYFDPAGKNGLASFTASMLDRGTTKRSSLDIANELEYVGASVGVSSDTEAVRFSGKSLSKDFNLVLDILSDQLRNPSFPQEQIDKVKGQMIVGLQMEQESPQQQAGRAFLRAIFPEGHPSRPQTLQEDAEAIQSFTRDDLITFHKKYYGPETTAIVIVGDVDFDEAVKAVENYFGDWKPTGTPAKMEFPKVQLAKSSSTQVIEMPDKRQVDVFYGHAGQLRRSDPDFYAAVVANHILGGGGGLDSKLGKHIRDDLGLVYSIGSGFDAGLGDGPWYMGFGTNPENVDKASAAADKVIRDFIKDGPTEQEFEETIDYITGSFPIRLETNDGVAGILSAAEFYGLGMDYIQKYTSYYRAVTIDQVREAAENHFHPDKATVVIAGPYKKQ